MKVSTNPAPARASRSWAEIDLDALLSNARKVLTQASGSRLLPMVKANAYGLGAIPVARALEDLDPWGFGVATPDEALELRSAGFGRRILVFTPARLDQLDFYRQQELTAVVDRADVLERWTAPCHIEIDTGMGRCGFRWDDPGLPDLTTEMVEGVFTHLHSADEDPSTVPDQLDRFRKALQAIPGDRLEHVSNSAGVWVVDEFRDVVRPGVFLYGSPAGDHVLQPEPVLSIYARVVSLREIRAGETVSYGAEWRAQQDTVVATLGIGFADGLPRSAAGRGEVLVNDERCPIVGRVTMDLVMVDVGEKPLRVGDTVTVVGGRGNNGITLAEYAASAGTTTYEVLVRLGNRLPRIYRSNGREWVE